MTAAPASEAEARSCAIVARYAGRWAGSVARASDEEGSDPPAPWFVDGYAGADLQRAALRGVPAHAAALLAVRALDDAGARARIILLEEDPGLVARLADELDVIGAGDRVRIRSDPATAEPGEIVLVEAPFASHAHRLAERIGDDPALVRLAPLAARALPWAALEPMAALASADVLVRFPGEDFEKQGRFAGPLADLPPHLRRVVEGCSALLGDARHGWLFAWREAQRAGGTDAALATAAERLQALLAAAGEARSTHALRVDGSGGAVHLLLSSADPEHPLLLNAALAEEGPAQKPPARRKPAARATVDAQPDAGAAAVPRADPPAPEPAQPAPPAAFEPAPLLDLFAETRAPDPEPPGPDLAAFADDLHARHAGARVPVRELMADAARGGLTPEQLRASLATLKRAGLASYRSVDADGAEIEFLAEPRVAPPRARKPRKRAPGELGLFDDPEE